MSGVFLRIACSVSAVNPNASENWTDTTRPQSDSLMPCWNIETGSQLCLMSLRPATRHRASHEKFDRLYDSDNYQRGLKFRHLFFGEFCRWKRFAERPLRVADQKPLPGSRWPHPIQTSQPYPTGPSSPDRPARSAAQTENPSPRVYFGCERFPR